jgi:hypothetical protein
MSKDIEQYIKQRLADWAEWCTKDCDLGLNYPSKSVEQRWREGGGQIIRGTGGKPIPINVEAEEIETCVKQYSQRHLLEANVLRRHYLLPHIQYRAKAKHLGISASKYLILLAKATSWIEGRLSAS